MKTQVLSLGWGIQSTTIAMMSALGDLPKLDYAIHSDTHHEHVGTYQFAKQWTSWLEKHGIKVITVSSPITKKATDEWGGVWIPAHTTYPDGRKSGMLRRQCTERWKIRPLRKWLRTNGHNEVDLWLGISLDEIQRVRDSDVKWLSHNYPLLDLGLTRQDCILWLQKNNLPIPPKSSCIFCPYHSKKAWINLKKANGSDWTNAVAMDKAIRKLRPGYLSYVHPNRKPLADLRSDEDFGAKQLDFDLFNATCDSGHCFL